MEVSLSYERHTVREHDRLPPSPPETDDCTSNASITIEETEFFSPPPTIIPTQILNVDQKTPDCHVPRDPRLIRLTANHPLNCEAPLSALFGEGFLTSPELFYVRNHGAVPEVAEQDIPNWEFTVEGLVENPMTLTLRQLIAEHEQITCPITLVCAGNRRKEQNIVSKTQGFSWGAAGVSTSLFTGVVMRDLIKKAKPRREAKFVCMEGADKLPQGYYGTSVKLNWAMDPNRGVMVAYMMNGEMLRPDHGKPLRAVIPGQIGGRSVKWLKKLIITKAPSDNYYHIYDNRVLPTMVSPQESAQNPNWWRDERYAIYDLNTNSAIVYPAHDEEVSVVDGPANYRAKGYAYGGGGRRITRVEVSIDKGQSWRLTDIDYPEDRFRDVDLNMYGGRLGVSGQESSFCWCFWSLDISVSDLAESNDLIVRAMDESMNLQPRDMYWNVLGMMNNPWFRVTILKQGANLRFTHPTQPGLLPGGWMESVKRSKGDLTNGHWGEKLGPEVEKKVTEENLKEVSMIQNDLSRVVSISELREHENAEQPWFVVNGEVYDGSTFLKEHPGGPQSIVSVAGLDATDEFLAIHSQTAKGMMPVYHVGSLDAASKAVLKDGEAKKYEPRQPSTTFLSPRSWAKAILHSKRSISQDTRIFTFKLENADQMLGLPVGQHLMLRLRDSDTREMVIRPYTPISTTSRKGYMDVLVKIYFDTKDKKGGKMGKALESLSIGHGVDVKGPIGKFEYHGRGVFSINQSRREASHFVMICAGSGITPIFQILCHILNDPLDATKCTVLNGNRRLEDILCKEDLDVLVKGKEDRAKIVYTLTKAPKEWKGLRGRIDRDLTKRYCEPSPETTVLVCGPDSLEKSIRIILADQGWSNEQIVFF